MRLLEFLEYSVSPWIRILACGLLGGALILLYRWDPERHSQAGMDDDPYSGVEFEPPLSRRSVETFYGTHSDLTESREKSQTTVIELQRYLDALSRNRIESVDRV
ncbi:MAG TPA: hypothetical protein PLG59_19935 [bacterium]|nr:hypothetical protein [bacterium]HQO36941.1 hypothetical protein [bacterium]HQP98263.1 hypothetical protein [bacterium]